MAAVVAIIMIGKTAAAIGLVLAFRYPLNTALTVGASLAQVGEFSFILAGLGMSLGLLPAQGQSLILAGALLSISLNSLVFAAIEPAQAAIRRRSDLARALERSSDPLAELPATVNPAALTAHVLLVGYGRVGRRIGAALEAQGIPYVVAEQNRELVERLRQRGIPAVSGNASEPAAPLRQANLGTVFMGEQELALAMTRHVLAQMGARLSAGEEIGVATLNGNEATAEDPSVT